MIKSLPFLKVKIGMLYKESMFSSVLKGKHKTGYKPEIESVRQQMLHSDDDGSYVRYAQHSPLIKGGRGVVTS